MLLTNPLLDERVANAIMRLAGAQGATVRQFTETTSQITAVPETAKAMVAEADFVVSTWFCSVLDPFFIIQKAGGRRWVRFIYFRNMHLLHIPQARFPAELVGEIIGANASRLPAGKYYKLEFSGSRCVGFQSAPHPPDIRQYLARCGSNSCCCKIWQFGGVAGNGCLVLNFHPHCLRQPAVNRQRLTMQPRRQQLAAQGGKAESPRAHARAHPQPRA